MSPADLFMFGAPVVGFIVWLVRMEGRVNSAEQRHEDHVSSNNVQHDQHTKRHEELKNDITYIRDRIDRALNGRHS